MSRKLTLWGIVIAAALILAACGRSDVVNNATDGGLDGSGDGPPPCTPSCTKICAMEKSCGIITASEVAGCESKCNADPSAAEILCLAQLVCKSTMDCAAANQCISNPKVPDLTVTHTASSPAAGQIRYRATVCNNGSGPATTFRVHFYRNRSYAPSAGEYGDRTAQINSLAAGACRSVTVTDTGLAKGSYNTWTQADADKAVVELNENNNVYGPYKVAVSGTTQLPDLMVQNLTASSSSSGYTSFYMTVCNYGQGATTSNSRYQLYFHSNSAPGPYTTVNRVFTLAAGFGPGKCANFQASSTFKSGTYRAWARADNDGVIKESNENNNTFGPVTYTVGGTTKLPDLVVNKMSAYANSSGLVTYQVGVCNLGNAAASNSYLWLYTHRNSSPGPYDKPDMELGLGYMSASTCKSLSWQTYMKPGTYLAWAMVDGKNVVKESNENNNTYGGVKYSVSGGSNLPDLVVSKMSASPTPTGSVLYTIAVCNNGKSTASGFMYLHMYGHRTSKPSVGDKPDGSIYLGYNISAGNCLTRTWSTNLKPGATYQSWAIVDGTNAVKESNENNNTYGIKVTVGGTGLPDLVVSNMTATSNSSGYTTYKINVCNQGTTASASYNYVWLYTNRSSKPGKNDQPNKVIYVGGISASSCISLTWQTSLSAGNYSSWAVADGYNYVKESNENNNVHGPVKFTVGGGSQPDLVISKMAVSVSSTGLVTYNVAMCNNGKAAASGSMYVYLYTNSKSKPGPGIKPSQSLYMGSYLYAGGCVSKSWQVTLAQGTYYSWAVADATNAVKESNESNNFYGPVTFYSPGSTKLPDLVSNLGASVSPSGAVTYKAGVCNKGAGTASGAIYLRLYVNSSTKPTGSSGYSKQLNMGSSLAAGACKYATWSVTLKQGTYSSWALVDPKNTIKEMYETNNAYGPVKVTVGGTTKLPDLVTSLGATTGSSGQVTYKAQVCNKGSGTASGTITLRFYVNTKSKPAGNSPYSKQLYVGSSLVSGACKTVSWTTSLKQGTYTSWALVDPQNTIKESNENNNAYGPVTVKVGGTTNKADLYIASISMNNTSSYNYFYVEVCNKGKVAVPYAKVDLYFNRSSKPSASTDGDLVSNIYNLNPGACQKRSFYTVLTPGTYLSWAYVDRTNVVPELNEGNNVFGPYKHVIPGSGKPDLQIISLTASQTSTYVYYYVTVCNKGTAKSGNTYLDLYYNRSSAPPTSLAGNNTTTMNALNPGACQTRTMYAGLPGGTYKSWVRVDRTNIVYESNENNNLKGPVTVTVYGTGKPDLVITNVSFATNTSGYHYYYVTLCNKGKATAVSTKIDVYYNRSSKPPATLAGDYTSYTGTLYAGACATRTVYAALGPGTYNSWFYLDRTNAVLESNENNNIFGPKKITIGGGGKPDLKITSLKPFTSASGYFYYYVTVCNVGKGTSTTTTIDVYYNRSSAPPTYMPGNRTTSMPQLIAGACTTRTIYVSNLPTGTLSSWARVDRNNSVAELNENNNLFGPVKIVNNKKQPDLEVTQLKSTPGPSAYTTYTVVVCNYGETTVSYTYVDIYYNRPSAPPTYQAGNTSAYVSSLAPKQCRQVNRYANLQPGSYTSWARVDRANTVAESNENNNVRGPYKFTIGGITPQCPFICGTLTGSCGLPSSQYAVCINYCNTMSQSKKNCAYKAAQAKNCNGIMGCL